MNILAFSLFYALLAFDQTTGFWSNKSPNEQLSAWLEGKTDSSDVLVNIDLASRANEDEKAKLSSYRLNSLIELREIAQGVADNEIDCSFLKLSKLRIMSAIINESKKNPYKQPESERRLNKLIIKLQAKIITHCISEYRQLFLDNLERYQPDAMSRLLDIAVDLAICSKGTSLRHNFFGKQSIATMEITRLDCAANLNHNELVSKDNLGNWVSYLLHASGRGRLCDIDDTGRNRFVRRSNIDTLVREYFVEPCKLIMDADDQTSALYSVVALARENRLKEEYLATDHNRRYILGLAAGYKVCQVFKLAQEDLFIDQLTKYIGSKKL